MNTDNEYLRYSSIGLVLPPHVESFVVDFRRSWECRSPERHGEELERFLRNLGSSTGRLLSKLQIRLWPRRLPTLTSLPNYLAEIDRLLSSPRLFPSFREFRFGILILGQELGRTYGPEVDVGTVKERFEKEVRRWFPSLGETGRLIVEWDVVW